VDDAIYDRSQEWFNEKVIARVYADDQMSELVLTAGELQCF